MVCDYIVNGGNKNDFIAYFKNAMSDNFDPDSDLQKIGVANQTTMLSSESLAIAEELKKAMQTKYGETKLDEHFQTFDTICSATQERQDAVLNLVHDFGLDLMLVIGGFNSSNTNHLAVLTSEFTATYHIDDPKCILADGSIRHKKVGGQEMQTTSNWLPTGEFTLGITAGASTPNNKIGEAVEKILLQRDVEIDKLMLNRTIMARL